MRHSDRNSGRRLDQFDEFQTLSKCIPTSSKYWIRSSSTTVFTVTRDFRKTLPLSKKHFPFGSIDSNCFHLNLRMHRIHFKRVNIFIGFLFEPFVKYPAYERTQYSLYYVRYIREHLLKTMWNINKVVCGTVERQKHKTFNSFNWSLCSLFVWRHEFSEVLFQQCDTFKSISIESVYDQKIRCGMRGIEREREYPHRTYIYIIIISTSK